MPRLLFDRWKPHLLLTLLCAVLYLPGLVSIPPLDRDEARFAEASRQMLDSGDYVTVRFQDELRAKKPIGIYWLQVAAVELTGAKDSIWAYRLPSVLGALAAVLLTFHFGQELFRPRAALLGAALLASCLLLISEAHQAKTDAVLLAAAVAAQGALCRYYRAGRDPALSAPGWGTFACFWVAQGAGILIKGPIVAMISVLTILALVAVDRRAAWLRRMRPILGLLLVVLIVAPWVLLVSFATKGQFIGQAVQQDLFTKLTGGAELHSAFFGTYLALATLTLWPASLFAGPALAGAIGRRKDSSIRFCLAWIGPAWLVFEMVPTKLPHYVLPLYPALALLAGAAIADAPTIIKSRWMKAMALLWSLAILVIAALPPLAQARYGHGIGASAIIASVVALAAGATVLYLARRGSFEHAAWSAACGSILFCGALFGWVAPSLDQLWVSERLAGLVRPGDAIVAVGYHEPSLVFLLGADTRLMVGSSAAKFLLDGPRREALVETAQEADFLDALKASGRIPVKFGEVDGFNYSRGRQARVGLWRLD